MVKVHNKPERRAAATVAALPLKPRSCREAEAMSPEDIDHIFGTPQARLIWDLELEISMIGAQVLECRQALGWSQEKLAREAGVSRITVVNVEGGTQPGGPRIATLSRLFRAMGKRIAPNLVDLEPQVNARRREKERAHVNNVVRYPSDAEPD